MSRIKPIDLSKLSRPAVKSQPIVTHAVSDDWKRRIQVAAWFVAAIVVVWVLSGRGVSPGPRPTPIDADGLHVLVIEPDDRATVTKGQNEFVNSVKIAEWVDSQEGQFRRYAESQNLDKADPVWRELRSQADGTYRVIVAKDRKLTRMQLPDGVEKGIRALEGVR